MFCLSIQSGPLVRGRRKAPVMHLDLSIVISLIYLLDANTVLYEPFVDGFGRVSHEDSASKVGLCKDIG